MGLDNELRVSIVADTAGLEGGLAEAQSEVTASSTAMAGSTQTLAQAQKAAKQAAEQLAVVYQQLGAAAADGNKSAQAGIRIFEEEAAAANAAVAAIMAHTESQKKDTAASYNRMEAMGSAKVAMGAMSGSLGGMEMGIARIAAGSKVLGPLLQEMIPLVLFAAGVEILYDLGKGIYNAFDMGGEAARAFQMANVELDGSFKALIDSTSLEADKIEAANAKLEHRPNPNAAKEAIDEALVEADKMNSKLDSLIGKEQAMLKMQGLAGSGTEQFLFNETGTKQEQVDLEQHQIHLEKANSLEQQLAESKSYAAVEQARLNHLLSEQTMIDVARNASQQASIAMTAIGVSDFHKEIEALDLIVNKTNQETAAIQEQIRLRDANVKHEELTAQTKEPKEKQDPAVKDYFEARKRDLEDYTRRIEEDTHQQEELLNHSLDAQVKDSDAAHKLESEASKHQTEAFHADREEQIAAAEEQAKREIVAAQWRFEETKREIAQQEELGRISHKVADQRLIDASLLRDSTISGAQKNVLALYDPIEGGKQLAGYQHAEDTRTADARKGAAEREAIEKQEQDQFIKGWKIATDAFNSDFTQALNSWMTHSETAGKAFGTMLGTLERQTIDFVAQYILKKAEMWAMDETMQLLGIAKEKTAQDTAATQQIASNNTVIASNQALQTSTTAIVAAETALATATTSAAAAFAAGIVGNTSQIASNVTLAESDQGLAAAEAALAAAPDGVIAAIAAGSEMYAAFIPWTTAAGFSVGGIVPGSYGAPMPAIVHAGERVLTASQNTTYEQLANSSTRASSVSLHYNPVIHGNADEGMLQEHSRQILSQVSRMIRPEARA